MALNKEDLKEIKKIVDGSIGKAIEKSEAEMSGKIESAIEKSEAKISDKIDFAIEKSEVRIEDEIIGAIKKSEDKVLRKMDRVISDTADINRVQNENIADHGQRIIKIEKRLSIGV